MLATYSSTNTVNPAISSHGMPFVMKRHEAMQSPLTDCPLLLLAEDDTMLRRLLTISLEQQQFCVIAVANGAEAVAIFSQHQFDLVLLDVMMPELDGFGACAQIRMNSAVPIIMLSAFSSPDVKAKARYSGATHFLNKPIRLFDLKRNIQDFLPKPYCSTDK